MKGIKILSLLFCVILLGGIFGVSAEEDCISITFAAQKDGEFISVPCEVSVTDGLAESYGYTVSEKDHNDEKVENATFFDALTAIHETVYGEEFTKESAKNYLDISGGMLTKVFGEQNASCGYSVNGKMPSDSTGYGYSADCARLENGDVAELWFYQDTESWSDCYTAFDSFEKNAETGEAVEVILYKLTYNPDWTSSMKPVDGTDSENNVVTINTVKSDGSISETLKDTDGNEIVPDEDGKFSVTFNEPGIHILTAQGFVDGYAPITAPYCKIVVEGKTTEAPTALSISYNAKYESDGKVIAAKGDKMTFSAVDQNGNETPVSWSTDSWGVTIDSVTGEAEFTNDISFGGTSYLYFTAVSKLDENVKKEITVQATGYVFSPYNKLQNVALSEDGQSEKTASLSAGVAGHNIWNISIPEGSAELTEDPEEGTYVKLKLYRPCKIDVSFTTDISEKISDSAVIEVTGVAVEGKNGERGKIYLEKTTDAPAPYAELCAYTEQGVSVSKWTSSDENICTVDEDGKATAVGTGSCIIYAEDENGKKGGIKVVVSDDEFPSFEALEFTQNAFISGTWEKGVTYKADTLEYELPIKNYSTSSLTLQATTLYNTEKYNALAEYTDINGEHRSVTVNSGSLTSLPDQPFEHSVMTITISEKDNPEKKTVYSFNVTRPRDTNKAIKYNGITLIPSDRVLYSVKYNGSSEGIMCHADENGQATGTNGVNSNTYYYRTLLFDDTDGFYLTLSASTAYAHIRYSEDGEEWKEIMSGGVTDKIPTSASQVFIEILDDSAYADNVKNGNDGFFESQPARYTLFIKTATLLSPQIITAKTDHGDFYPEFSPDKYSFRVMVENQSEAPILTFTAQENAEVKSGPEILIPDDNGKYTVTLKTSQTEITVTDPSENFSNTYKFAYSKKSALDVPDKVVDYLCIGSQYTNASYGINPELTLSGNMKSLGNFGGYITYYYENPLTDNPKNKYGIDFYVIGNSQENNIDSMAEAGQVYVSEDGEKWYPIAGSEHYEDTTITDYTITYYKTTDGKSEWKDSLGNKISYSPKAWPSESYYSFNGTEYTFTGVLLKCQDGTVTGGGTTADYAAKTRFGYPDYYASNISGLTVNDVNPYVESPSKSNGIDLAWAVDENGMPIDIDSMDIHYVKIATASNIHAGSFAEKSTEVTYVVRTSEQSDEVGKTNGISGIVISDGASSKTVSFDGKTEISADIGDMKYIGISVIGASGEDNIYVNSRRISCNEAADGFKVVQGKSTIIRIIVQNGEKEPAIYHITLNGNAQETNRLIEGVKINVSGTIRAASTKNETDYTLSVGHRISEISVIPTIAPGLDYTVNSDEPCESYALEYGDNTFEITSGNETVTLTVTRNDPPASADNNISVYFILYGDSIHDEETKHIFRNDIDTMPIWIPRTRYIVPEGSTALDVFEKALTAAGLSWVNAGGNYICEIDGLCEFDNGPLSGWMYTVNGSYPELGVSEMELHTGDTVLFHYTDNFTLERSGDKWNGTASWNDAKDNDSNEKEPKKEDDISEKEPQENEDISDKEKEEEFIMPFKDIPEGEWYFEAVEYASRNGLMNGVSETEFAPHLPTTRAMLVTILFRLEETEKEYKNSIFSDVKDGLWYTDAVNWAAENGIVNGISDTLFDPDSPITREQTAVMLYRYAQYKKLDTAESKTISSFEDSSDVSVWAKSAMEWAYASELINGMSETVLAPREGASRAQTATMLMRFIENTDTEE